VYLRRGGRIKALSSPGSERTLGFSKSWIVAWMMPRLVHSSSSSGIIHVFKNRRVRVLTRGFTKCSISVERYELFLRPRRSVIKCPDKPHNPTLHPLRQVLSLLRPT
jgi:hypothetical protein